MPDRITLDGPLFPVQAFFNAVSDSSFVRVIRDLKRGVGASVEDCHCEFPDDIGPDELPFDGVRFVLYEDEVILTLQELAEILKAVCEVQEKRLPEQRVELRALWSGVHV